MTNKIIDSIKHSRRWDGLRLRTKLTLLIEGLVLLLVAVTGMIATVREKGTLERELRKRGFALAGDLAIFAARPLLADDPATLRRFINHSMNQDYVRYVGILDPGGRVVMHSDLSRVGEVRGDGLSRTAIASPVAGFATSTLPPGEELVYDIYAPVIVSGARLGTVILGYSRLAVEQELADTRVRIVSLGLWTAMAGGIIAFFLSSYICTPIRRITGAMCAASAGDFHKVSSGGRNDEIGILAASFNRMAEDLSRHRKHLEVLVDERTTQWRKANEQLHLEVAERVKVEEELRDSQTQLRRLATYLESVRERERTEIAREIHDELGQALTALKMDVHWLGQRLAPGQEMLAAKAGSMSKLIDSTVQAVRRISSELRPKMLDDLGLSAAMEWQAQEFEKRFGIPCHICSEPEDIVLDPLRSTAFFRIFQETLTNVVRHAQASRVEVSLRRTQDLVELIVMDDGKGITLKQTVDPRSLGIIGMRERLLPLEGVLRISGAPARGTTVRVTIPLHLRGDTG